MAKLRYRYFLVYWNKSGSGRIGAKRSTPITCMKDIARHEEKLDKDHPEEAPHVISAWKLFPPYPEEMKAAGVEA